MGKKEDDAADFLEKMLEGDVKFVDVDDDNEHAMNRFESILADNKIEFDEETEREYQAYLKKTSNQGWAPISRAEFLAVRHSTSQSKNN